MGKEFWGKVKYKLDIAVKYVIFIMVYCISGIYKNKKRYQDLWVISERGDDAGDNGFALFCYIRREHPECNVKYIIKKDCPDADKVQKIGEIIPYGSLEHYLSIILARVLISSHLLGYTTNDYLFKRFEKRGMLKGKKIFLQHGITKDDIRQLYRDEAIPDMFVCALEQEAAYVKKKFHQPDSVVSLTGFCRYDALPLKGSTAKSRIILAMPTWRRDLYFYSKKDFKQSEYYRNWQALLSSPAVSELLEYYDYQLLFYPHHQMQKFVDEFSAGSDRIMIASRDRYEVQQLLIHSDVLITDFSSVFFDYAYMQKPMIYYQFDKEDYREKNYQQGWFRYEKDGFGRVLEDIKMVEVELKKILDRGCTMEKLYWDRQDKMFKYHDHKNCERNYKSIIEKLQNREN